MNSPEVIQKVIDISAPSEIKLGDLTYTSKPVHLLAPPFAEAVKISSLQGLVDLYAGDLDEVKDSEGVFVHIVSPTSVELIAKDFDDYERQRVYAIATYPANITTFPFGRWLDPESFIIGAQQCFQQVKVEKASGGMANDLDYVVKLASKISAGRDRLNEDDGISQTVQVKAGVTLKGEETLKPIVNLAPFRTFAEIDQVVSRFVFRARATDDGATLALFEADGGRWRLDAVASIATWLKGKFGTSPVVS